MAGEKPVAGKGPPMTLERFRMLLDAYGAAPARWPEAERAGGEALLRTLPEAATLAAEARALDTLLDGVPLPEPSPGLLANILSQTPRPGSDSPAAERIPSVQGSLLGRIAEWFAGAPRVGPVAAGPLLAGAMTLGLVAGVVVPVPGQTPDNAALSAGESTADDVVFAAFGLLSDEEARYE